MLDNVMIGKRIRECRIAAGISQELLAAWADLSAPHISRIENGKKNVSAESIAAIADVLRTTTDYLLLGHQQMKHVHESPLVELLKDLTPEEYELIYQTVKIVLTRVRSDFETKNT